jgi:ribosomal protein S18 acetylase RimI-like enzyme
VSELRPSSPLRRPDTARPRAEPHPEVEPPSLEELAAIQRHLVILPEWEGGRVEDDTTLEVTLVRGPGDGPDLSYAAQPRWSADSWPERLDRVSRRMRHDGVWPSLLWCDVLDRPTGLDGELERQGWVRALGETVLWVGHASVVPHLDPLLRIEAVQPRSVATHESLERRIFGIDDRQAERRRASLAAGLEQQRLRAWVVWLADEPMAVARLSQGPGVAGIHGVGVVPERRGQGFGSLITVVATRAGMAVGNRLVWLSVREEDARALSVYTRLGFARAFAWSRYLLTEDPRRPR